MFLQLSCDISEKNVLILLIFVQLIEYHALLMQVKSGNDCKSYRDGTHFSIEKNNNIGKF